MLVHCPFTEKRMNNRATRGHEVWNQTTTQSVIATSPPPPNDPPHSIRVGHAGNQVEIISNSIASTVTSSTLSSSTLASDGLGSQNEESIPLSFDQEDQKRDVRDDNSESTASPVGTKEKVPGAEAINIGTEGKDKGKNEDSGAGKGSERKADSGENGQGLLGDGKAAAGKGGPRDRRNEDAAGDGGVEAAGGMGGGNHGEDVHGRGSALQ